MFCGKCGSEINDGDAFCTKCGASINNKNTQVTKLSKNISDTNCVTEYDSNTLVDFIDTVKFGNYMQNDAKGKVKEPIEWIVLDKKDGQALLLSKYILDCKSMINKKENVSFNPLGCWEGSDLLKWLNNDFLNIAFTKDDQTLIVSKIVKYKFDEIDVKVFCLNEEEAKKYFGDGGAVQINYRLATRGTNYAKSIKCASTDDLSIPNRFGGTLYIKETAYVDGMDGNSSFWLRSNENYNSSDQFMYVNETGYVKDLNADECLGVRPAIWIKI